MRAVAGDGSDALSPPSSGVEHRIVFTPSGLSGTVAHGTHSGEMPNAWAHWLASYSRPEAIVSDSPVPVMNHSGK